MKLHMRLPAPGSAEAQLTVRALEGLGSFVEKALLHTWQLNSF
jgi:hypothetical protein